jgi:type III pantothenate kinase
MLLVVDVGNTQTHIGAYQGAALVHDWRFATVRESTADELGAALRALLALRGFGFADIHASIVSATVPSLRPQWTAMAQRYLGHEMLLVGPGLKTGMPIRYDNPREIGPDRLVNAVAGYERVQGACVIVDFGTAVTHDVVSASGEYLGGVIFPGLEISMEALANRAAALPAIDLSPPRALVGKSTVDAIRAGVLYGYAGMCDAIVDRLHAELGDFKALATGGLAGAVVPHCRTIDIADDLLTLTGLRIIWERNRG